MTEVMSEIKSLGGHPILEELMNALDKQLDVETGAVADSPLSPMDPPTLNMHRSSSGAESQPVDTL
jgi:hypothetical protein